MKSILTQNIEKKMSNDLSDEMLIAELEKLIESHSPQKELIHLPVLIEDILNEHLQLCIENREMNHNISTGFEKLDELLVGGFYPEEFVVIGARPGMGKTILMLSLAKHMVQSFPVLYFSFNNSTQYISNTFLTNVADLPLSIFRGYHLNLDLYKSNVESIKGMPLYISDNGAESIEVFMEYCEKMVLEKSIKVVMIDDVQSMGVATDSKYKFAELSNIAAELNKMARRLKICIIASSQLNRNNEGRVDKRPMLFDLRTTGALEQNASKVIFIFRPEYYKIMEDEVGNSTEYLVELLIEKNNSGNTGIVNLQMSENRSSIINISNDAKKKGNYNEPFMTIKSRIAELVENAEDFEKF
jgi:replicative DNA helicase